MKSTKVLFTTVAVATLTLSLFLAGCSGVKPLKEGQTLRCPSCGQEFKVEEGAKEEKK